MLPPIAVFPGQKEILRERMKAERRAASKARPDAATHAARNFLVAIPRQKTDIVSLYYPMRHELDTEPLAAALFAEGVKVVLPVTGKRGTPLVFRQYEPGDDLVPGGYGEMIPAGAAPILGPDIIVAPLLAFTRRGERLGYGGGYYDRTIEKARKEGKVTVVGFAFGAQEVDAMPVTPLDQRLDWIVTEREAIRC